MIDLERYLEKRRREIDDYLVDRLRLLQDREHKPLWDAVEYGLMSGGKRIRPVLTIAAAESVGGDSVTVMPFACAIEMIHCFSLIHDDLPAMDDDELRRNKPTVHKVHGEAMAVLAGDALFSLAFQLMSDISVWVDIYHHEAVDVIQNIARICGPSGMAGGQALDILSENRQVTEPELRLIHQGKTAALISASIYTGARLSGATGKELEVLSGYAEDVGLAFQIRDDLLNVSGSETETGKPIGTDAKRGKATFPMVVGLEESQRLLSEISDRAVESLAGFSGSADPLRAIAQYLARRNS